MSAADRELLASFRLTPERARDVWLAYQESPQGVIACALRAQQRGADRGGTGAGLLLTMIREREHVTAADVPTRPYTGWRFVRGSHGGNYVRDPRGVDPLPPYYDVRPRHVIEATRTPDFDDAM